MIQYLIFPAVHLFQFGQEFVWNCPVMGRFQNLDFCFPYFLVNIDEFNNLYGDILGAGVSAPFGFPVGRQMRDAICNGAYLVRQTKPQDTLSPKLMEELLTWCLGNYHAVYSTKRFLDSYRDADLYSIDAWLQANMDVPNILQLGKYAIAAILLDAEARAVKESAPTDQDWFAWLWNQMWTDKIEDLGKNKVDFITFNYDRIFEWKLKRQIEMTYLGAKNEDKKAAYESLQKRIVHVHGVLMPPKSPLLYGFGEMPFSLFEIRQTPQSEDNITKFVRCVQAFSQSINIVCENPTDNLVVDEAKKLINKPNVKIVFLGFSFDTRNIAKLSLDQFAKTTPHPYRHKKSELNFAPATIIGSAMGLRGIERSDIETMLDGKIILGDGTLDAVEFCRSHLKVR